MGPLWRTVLQAGDHEDAMPYSDAKAGKSYIPRGYRGENCVQLGYKHRIKSTSYSGYQHREKLHPTRVRGGGGGKLRPTRVQTQYKIHVLLGVPTQEKATSHSGTNIGKIHVALGYKHWGKQLRFTWVQTQEKAAFHSCTNTGKIYVAPGYKHWKRTTSHSGTNTRKGYISFGYK